MSIAPALKPYLAEVRSNPRLRWGLWLIVATLWFYGVLVLRDEVPRQTDAYRAVTKKLARTQVVAAQTEWPARRDEARAAGIEYENRLWHATTSGLAEASFRDWLAQVAQDSGAGRPQINAASQEEGKGPTAGLWKVTARMSLDFAPTSFYPMLTRIATYQKRVGVESLLIRGAPPPKAELMLVAYFQRSDVEATKPEGVLQ